MQTDFIYLDNEAATLTLANQLASVVSTSTIIFLHGTLGAGKTTFSRGFLQGLGYNGTVKSPTYTLVEPYQVNDLSIFHFDLYRVTDPEELEYIGIRDYFAPGAISLVEWPECGEGWLPAPDLSCYIELQAEGRTIKIVSHSERGNKVIKDLEFLRSR